MTPAPYAPAPSLTPIEAFRLGASEGRAESRLSESRALCAEGIDRACVLMASVAA